MDYNNVGHASSAEVGAGARHTHRRICCSCKVNNTVAHSFNDQSRFEYIYVQLLNGRQLTWFPTETHKHSVDDDLDRRR